MTADAKSKEKTPPDPKVAGSDPKTSDPKTPVTKTPEPMQPVPDPVAKPAEFLASQGLAKRGSQSMKPQRS